jgi:hypothetical protein
LYSCLGCSRAILVNSSVDRGGIENELYP